MADDNVKYQHKTVQAIRGTEARSISKWETQGWELVDQTSGKLRTTLNFRKPAPKVPWIPVAVLLGVGVLILGIVGIVGIVEGGDESESKPVASSTSTPSETADTSTEEPEETRMESDDADEIITANNNDDFAAVLAAESECDRSIKTFAKENAGRTIEFNGSIADIANHASYDTRYDILIVPGDKGSQTTVGPYFKYEDVGFSDLNFTGQVPNRFGTDDKLHLVADVDNYKQQQCVLFLQPVATEFR